MQNNCRYKTYNLLHRQSNQSVLCVSGFEYYETEHGVAAVVTAWPGNRTVKNWEKFGNIQNLCTIWLENKQNFPFSSIFLSCVCVLWGNSPYYDGNRVDIFYVNGN